MSDLAFQPMALDVAGAAREVLEALPDTELRARLRSVVDAFAGEGCGARRLPPAAHIPMLVHAAVTGEGGRALPLSGIALLLYLGIDLLDELMDADPPRYWRGESPAETLLVAATLVSAAPQLALARIDTDDGVRVAMQEALAEGLAAMAAGQRREIVEGHGPSITPRDVEAIVSAKSGAMTGMLARLGALLAGAGREECGHYQAWGAAYGTADQLRSDCAELFSEGPVADLRNGTVTHPLACLLQATPEGERPALLALLKVAADGPTSRELVRGALVLRGALAMSAVVNNWHVELGLAALARTHARDPAAAALRALIEGARLKTAFITPPEGRGKEERTT